MERKALGRGINALIPQTKEEKGTQEVGVAQLKVSELALSRFQPRMAFNPQKEKELINSIKEKGVIQPILVRQTDAGYELIAGERRLRAVKALGLEEIPAIVKSAVSDIDALELSLIENIQREELDPIEEANAYQRLEKEFNFTQDKIGEAIGKDRSTVANLLRLLKLPKEIQELLSQGKLTVGHGRLLLALENTQDQIRLSHQIVAKEFSVRETENLVKKNLRQKSKRSVVTRKDPHIVKLEEELQEVLGTKVRISHLRKRGKICIDYYSLDDLERLYRLLKRKTESLRER